MSRGLAAYFFLAVAGLAVAFGLHIFDWYTETELEEVEYTKTKTVEAVVTAEDHFEAIGLNINQPMALVYGDTVEGTFGSIRGSGSYVILAGRMSLSGDFSPGSVLRLLVEMTNGESFVLEHPLANITFIQKPGVNPTLKLMIDREVVGSIEFQRTTTYFGDNFGKFQTEFPDVIKVEEGPKPPLVWNDFSQLSVRDELANRLTEVVITIDPSQLRDILGSN